MADELAHASPRVRLWAGVLVSVLKPHHPHTEMAGVGLGDSVLP